MSSRFLISVVGLVACVLLAACDDHTSAPPSGAFDIPWQTIARFDESASVSFNEIWASSADDVFLAYTLRTVADKISDVRVAHFDGAAWTESSVPWTGAATSIWGSSRDDIYVAAGTLTHFDGVKWTALPVGAHGVTGSGPNNVFIANAAAVLRYNGADWDTLRTLDGNFHRLLAAAPDGSLFFSTGYGTSIWNGSTWKESSFPTPTSFCPFSVSDAFSVASYGDGAIYHWDGQEWTWQTAAAGVIAMGGTTGADVYAVGQVGVLFHYDGSQWDPRPHVTAHSLYRACSTPSGAAVAGGSNKVLWLDGTGSRVLREAVIDYTRFPIAAESSEHFMLSDFNSIYRYDAGKWSEAPLPFYAGQARALGGRAMGDMYASTDDGLVAHYDGTSWDRVDSLVLQQNAFWVTPAGIAYSVGGGSVYRRAEKWNAIKSGSQYLYLITGDGGDGIVTGARLDADPEQILISHFDGEEWSDLPAAPDFVYDFWAGSGMDLYLAGQNGVYRLKHDHFERLRGPVRTYDFIFGTSDGRVFATTPNEMAIIGGWSLRVSPTRGPWEAVQAADGSIVADVGHELAVWTP